MGQTQCLSYGTSWSLFGTCAVLNTSDRPNTILAQVLKSWSLLEPVRNLQLAWAKRNFCASEPTGTCSDLCCFDHRVQAKYHFHKSATVAEPVGTWPEPVDLQGSLLRNHHFAWVPVLQYILLNKSTGAPCRRPLCLRAPPAEDRCASEATLLEF